MTRTITLAALALSTFAALDATACGGGGGGYRGGFGGGYGGGFRHAAPVYRPAPTYTQPVLHRPAITQPSFQQPITQPQVVQRPAIQQPIQRQPIALQPQPQRPVQQPVATTPEQSALGALQALMGGQAAAAPAPQQPAAAGHVGVWSATVGTNNRVQLQLAAGGVFRWIANSGGKVSSFEGRYTIAGGQLTLVRNDNQQLAGSWTANATGGFRFTLAGQQSGLLFARG